MSLTYTQVIPPNNIRINGCGNCSFNEEFHQVATLKPQTECCIQLRFSLPRTTTVSCGSKLLSVTFIYKITSGNLTEMTASISKDTYRNNVLSTNQSLAIIYPDANSPGEIFKLTPQDSICKAKILIESPVFENDLSDCGISWLYNIYTVSATTTTLVILGAEITYIKNTEVIPADTPMSMPIYTESFELLHTSSGLLINIDTSEAPVTVTLPTANDLNVGVGYKIKIVKGGNPFRIAPVNSDYIIGVGLNPDVLLAGNFILLDPIKDNFIKIRTFAPGVWRVTSAAGDWSLD